MSDQPREFCERREDVPPFNLRLMSYRLGPTYHCSIRYFDMSFLVSRGQGASREEAESIALKKARNRLELPAH